MPKGYTGVRGHGLKDAGRPHDATGKRSVTNFGLHFDGVGRGLCGCGELSPELTSNYQRKNWHRTHKTEITQKASST